MTKQELIHHYLDGGLDAVQEDILFAELASDPSLRNELQEQMRLHSLAKSDMAATVVSPELHAAVFSAVGLSFKPTLESPTSSVLPEVAKHGLSYWASMSLALVVAGALSSIAIMRWMPSAAATLLGRNSVQTTESMVAQPESGAHAVASAQREAEQANATIGNSRTSLGAAGQESNAGNSSAASLSAASGMKPSQEAAQANNSSSRSIANSTSRSLSSTLSPATSRIAVQNSGSAHLQLANQLTENGGSRVKSQHRLSQHSASVLTSLAVARKTSLRAIELTMADNSDAGFKYAPESMQSVPASIAPVERSLISAYERDAQSALPVPSNKSALSLQTNSPYLLELRARPLALIVPTLDFGSRPFPDIENYSIFAAWQPYAGHYFGVELGTEVYSIAAMRDTGGREIDHHEGKHLLSAGVRYRWEPSALNMLDGRVQPFGDVYAGGIEHGLRFDTQVGARIQGIGPFSYIAALNYSYMFNLSAGDNERPQNLGLQLGIQFHW